jgi:hypothetical protein
MDSSLTPSTSPFSSRGVPLDTRPLAPAPKTPPSARSSIPYPKTPSSLRKRSFDKYYESSPTTLVSKDNPRVDADPSTFCQICRSTRPPQQLLASMRKRTPFTCTYCKVIRYCRQDPFAALDELWRHFDDVVFYWDKQHRALDHSLLEVRDIAYRVIKNKVAAVLSGSQPDSFHYKVCFYLLFVHVWSSLTMFH